MKDCHEISDLSYPDLISWATSTIILGIGEGRALREMVEEVIRLILEYWKKK
jgi:hypothetical protein